MKRPFRSALLVLLVVVPPLSGCTGPAGPSCGADGVGPVTFATTKTLNEAQWKRLKDRWHFENPDEELKIVRLPARSDEQRAQLAATLQMAKRGSAHRYDVVEMDIVFVPEFVRAGYLHPLDQKDFPRQDFLAKPWDISLHDRQLHAVPFTTNVGLLYYWAEELRPIARIDKRNGRWKPRSWGDVQAVADESSPALQTPEPVGKLPPRGYAGQLARYEGLTVNTMEVIEGSHGALPVQDREVTSEQRDAASSGVKFLLDGLDKGWIDKKVLSYDEDTSLNAFRDRRVLILRHWPSAWTQLADPEKGSVEVTPLPPDSNVLGGENVAVAACSPNRTSALRLVKFLTTEQTQRDLFTDGLYLPTRPALYKDASLTDQQPPVFPPQLMPSLQESVLTAQLRPQVPDYLGTSRVIQDRVHERLTEAVAPGPAPDPRKLVDELADALEH